MAGYDNPKKIYLRERFACRADINGRVFSFSLRVEDLDAKGIVTDDPDLAGVQLARGQEILVRYFRTDSAYQFLTKVTEEIDNEGLRLIRLAFPSRITRYQRRKHSRVRIPGTARWRPLDQKTMLERAHLLDLSIGGIKISTPRRGIFNRGASPTGVKLYIELVLHNGDFFAGLNGAVRKVFPDPQRERNVNVQIEFTHISQRTQDKLKLLIRRNS